MPHPTQIEILLRGVLTATKSSSAAPNDFIPPAGINEDNISTTTPDTSDNLTDNISTTTPETSNNLVGENIIWWKSIISRLDSKKNLV